jgi:hypothetical protein
MQTVLIRGRIYRHRRNSGFAAGADDPDGDFATVGYENSAKHEITTEIASIDPSGLDHFSESKRIAGILTSFPAFSLDYKHKQKPWPFLRQT